MSPLLLSPREIQVIKSAAVGLTDKEMAINFGVSQKTISTYWDRIRTKLPAINRSHAVALYLQAEFLASKDQTE